MDGTPFYGSPEAFTQREVPGTLIEFKDRADIHLTSAAGALYSNFCAELVAIKLTLTAIIDLDMGEGAPKSIIICTDSQSSVISLSQQEYLFTIQCDIIH
jgi:hypothetical protein